MYKKILTESFKFGSCSFREMVAAVFWLLSSPVLFTLYQNAFGIQFLYNYNIARLLAFMEKAHHSEAQKTLIDNVRNNP